MGLSESLFWAVVVVGLLVLGQELLLRFRIWRFERRERKANRWTP